MSVGYSMPAGAFALRVRIENRDRIDDRELRVRIRTEPRAVVLERGARRAEVPRRPGSACSGCSSSRMSTGGSPGSSNRSPALDEVRARRPGEVVHVGLHESMRRTCRAAVRVATTRARWRRQSSRAAPSA